MNMPNMPITSVREYEPNHFDVMPRQNDGEEVLCCEVDGLTQAGGGNHSSLAARLGWLGIKPSGWLGIKPDQACRGFQLPVVLRSNTRSCIKKAGSAIGVGVNSFRDGVA